MIIAKNKLGTTTFYKEDKILISVYKGRIDIELALSHLAEIVTFYKKNEVVGSVVDIKEIYGSFAKIFEYMKEYYYPAAVKSGLKYQGFVASEDLIINNLSLKLTGMATSFKLKSKVFREQKEGENWVRTFLKKT